jgi:ParB-like chromosome segregation protein Spo0J
MHEHEPEPTAKSVRLPRSLVEPFDEPETESSSRLSPLREGTLREGLPPGFRMRADAHYVDQLDARPSTTPVRLIETGAFDTGHQHGDTPSPAFVESIKRFGVLQPLLVSGHGARYRVIAGRRRLAAAVAAGLREVPCLVQHVDVEHAEQMALASNLPAARPRPATTVASAPDRPGITAELTNIVSALVSCAELLASPSALTQAVAADLVRAEAARALDSLVVIRILRDEMPVSRAPIATQTLLDRLAAAAALERQIRGIALQIDAASEARATMVKADARLVICALSALASAATALVESTAAPRGAADGRPAATIRLRCSLQTDQILFSVIQQSVELPAAWLARPFEIAWPIRNGTAALTQLQAARKVAQGHGGSLEVTAIDGGTSFALEMPIVGASA